MCSIETHFLSYKPEMRGNDRSKPGSALLKRAL